MGNFCISEILESPGLPKRLINVFVNSLVIKVRVCLRRSLILFYIKGYQKKKKTTVRTGTIVLNY